MSAQFVIADHLLVDLLRHLMGGVDAPVDDGLVVGFRGAAVLGDVSGHKLASHLEDSSFARFKS